MNKLIICLLFLCLIKIKADLPVHCYTNHITGTWDGELSDPRDESTQACGHDKPDDPQTSHKAVEFIGRKHPLKITLNSDNSASANDLETKEAYHGKWTMIYDMGFQIEFPELILFTFSKYKPIGNDRYESVCSETLVGWYNYVKENKKGCFKASKKGASTRGEIIDFNNRANIVTPDEFQNEALFLQVSGKGQDKVRSSIQNEEKAESSMEKQKALLETLKKKLVKLNDELNFNNKKVINHDKVVETLNNNPSQTWKAASYKQFENYTLNDANKFVGKLLEKGSKEHMTSRISFAEQKSSVEFQDLSDLPKEYDLRQYITRVRNQESCGSCYIFATVSMLEARIKMKYKMDVDLSVQQVIDCNYYTQGCDGGFPFLVNKFFNENEIYSDSCYPYKGRNGQCKRDCKNEIKEHFKVKDYKFIGGAYGMSNERNIMEEILANGPVTVAFEPKVDFMYYKSGIYHSVEALWIKNGQQRPIWEKVDHSVLCVGWGEENGEKYWIIQNTWGADWGERGFFRMRRGSDESAIESMAEAATPELI